MREKRPIARSFKLAVHVVWRTINIVVPKIFTNCYIGTYVQYVSSDLRLKSSFVACRVYVVHNLNKCKPCSIQNQRLYYTREKAEEMDSSRVPAIWEARHVHPSMGCLAVSFPACCCFTVVDAIVITLFVSDSMQDWIWKIKRDEHIWWHVSYTRTLVMEVACFIWNCTPY